MARCLIALGSNLGDRAATLDAAIDRLSIAPNCQVTAVSRWLPSEPVGAVDAGGEFINGAALLETSLTPQELHILLQRIETEHGRVRRTRWEARTLDLDLLLYDQQTVSTSALSVPHPRMSYRRFVLEPAAEIAGDWVHPTIGWTLEELRHHLDDGADFVAILSPLEAARREVATAQSQRPGIFASEPPLVDPRWPKPLTTWLKITPDAPSADLQSSPLPKLSVVLDPSSSDDRSRKAVADEIGRGPMLQISAASTELLQEVSAAIEAVWPHLGPPRAGRLQ